jgi:hypothetical protein
MRKSGITWKFPNLSRPEKERLHQPTQISIMDEQRNQGRFFKERETWPAKISQEKTKTEGKIFYKNVEK